MQDDAGQIPRNPIVFDDEEKYSFVSPNAQSSCSNNFQGPIHRKHNRIVFNAESHPGPIPQSSSGINFLSDIKPIHQKLSGFNFTGDNSFGGSIHQKSTGFNFTGDNSFGGPIHQNSNRVNLSRDIRPIHKNASGFNFMAPEGSIRPNFNRNGFQIKSETATSNQNDNWSSQNVNSTNRNVLSTELGIESIKKDLFGTSVRMSLLGKKVFFL